MYDARISGSVKVVWIIKFYRHYIAVKMKCSFNRDIILSESNCGKIFANNYFDITQTHWTMKFNDRVDFWGSSIHYFRIIFATCTKSCVIKWLLIWGAQRRYQIISLSEKLWNSHLRGGSIAFEEQHLFILAVILEYSLVKKRVKTCQVLILCKRLSIFNIFHCAVNVAWQASFISLFDEKQSKSTNEIKILEQSDSFKKIT